MKRTFTILLAMLISCGLFAQHANDEGRLDHHHEVDPNGIIPFEMMSSRSEMIFDSHTDILTGSGIEGDYISQMKFTNDGQYILVTNRHSYNVTVLEWESMEPVADIPVADGPVNIALNDEIAVIPCLFSDSVFVIDLQNNFSATGIAVSEYPGVAGISPDGTKAYIGTEGNLLDVIDLQTMEVIKTFNGFPVYYTIVSWSSGSNRNFIKYNPFLITPDGSELIVGDVTNNRLMFINSETGEINDTITIEKCRHVAFSGDSSKLLATSRGEPHMIYQIDYENHEIINSIKLNQYDFSRPGMSVNEDGSKALISINGNQGGLVDFIDNEIKTYPSTYTAFWLDNFHDFSHGVHGNFRFSIIDFETETVSDQFYGISQNFGAASPVGPHIVACDPLRHEAIHFYDVSDPANINYRGFQYTGDDLEADAPYRIAISEDGSRAIVSNALSFSVSLLDLLNNKVDTVIHLNSDVDDVAISADGTLGAVAVSDSAYLALIDMETMAVTDMLQLPGEAAMVELTSDGSMACVAQLAGSDRVFLVEIEDGQGTLANTIYTGNMGVNYAGQGIYSEIEITPDDNYLIVAGSFDNVVNIIDLTLQGEIASIPSSGFPLQIAISDDSELAAVTNMQSNQVSIIELAGTNSQMLGQYNVSGGPRRIDYDPLTGNFAVCTYDNDAIEMLNPETGEVVATDYFGNYGKPLQVRYLEDGSYVTMVYSNSTDMKNRLIHGDDHYELPTTPAYFDLSPDKIAAAAMTGPDYVSVINLTDVGIVHIPVDEDKIYLKAFPNPFNENGTIEFSLTEQAHVKLTISDISGKLVDMPLNKVYTKGTHQITYEAKGLEAGIYVCSIKAGKKTATVKFVIE